MGDRLTGLAGLGEHVAESLEARRVARGGASRVRAKLVDPSATRRSKPAPRLRASRIAGAVALAAAFVLVVAALVRPRPSLTFAVAAGEPGRAGESFAAPPTADLPVGFSDGTRLVLAPSSRARVTEVTASGARLLVENGRLHADVVHTGEARWAVEAGPFEVRVTGTSFDVDWDPRDEAIVVTLTDGSVVVAGCVLGGEGRRVVRGQQLRASCKQQIASLGPASPSTAEPPAAVEAPPPAPRADDAPAVSASALPDAHQAPKAAARDETGPRIVALAKARRHHEALSVAESRGFAATCDLLSASELLLLADAARYERRFERATEALSAARRRFPKTDPAAAAAFELGRIAFDVRSDFAVAGDWFDAYLRERPGGPLEREALGRALEARHRSGDATRAEHLAVRYLRAYPEGPHAALARKLSGGAP